MSEPMSRRTFATALASSVILGQDVSAAPEPEVAPRPHPKRTEAPFERDYPPPAFTPSWRRPQINHLMVQDFVIFAHTDIKMVEKLLNREPGLINAFIDWGGGDWESALGAASHMGNREMASFLLERGARMDIFCAVMMGQLEAVKAFLTLQPKLIDAKGPHGFSLHFHAQLAGPDADRMLEYLQSIKKVDLPPNPFLKKNNTHPKPG